MTGKPPPKLEPVSRTCLLHFSHTFGVDVRVFGCEPASCLCVLPSCMTIATLHASAETFLCSAHGRVEGDPHPARGDTVLALPYGDCVPRQTRRVQQQDHGLVRRNRACHRAARKALVCCVRSRGCITLAASVHQAPWASTGVLSISLRVRVSGDVQIQLLASPHDLPDGRQDLIARYCFNTSALPTETLIPLNAKTVRGCRLRASLWVRGLPGAPHGSQVDVLRPAVVDVERFEMHLLLENPARIKEPEWVLCPVLCVLPWCVP